MRKVLWGIYFLWLSVSPALVWADEPESRGDDNPYPLACASLAGSWQSDSGPRYVIDQRGCKWLQVQSIDGEENHTTTIVPDNKARMVYGSKQKELVRYRWNAHAFGSAVETHRTMTFPDRIIYEVVVIERVNAVLLLESTYQTTQSRVNPKDAPEQKFSQRVFRWEETLNIDISVDR